MNDDDRERLVTEWDAAKYHRLSDPQLAWGRRVAERLVPAPGERILDIGCGTGRLTTELALGASHLRIVGLDLSHAMITQARRARGTAPVAYLRANALALPFARQAFDAVFSAATFHWVVDHDRLFAGIHDVLRPGGRLVAQCGGRYNLDRLIDRAHALMESPAYSPFFGEWSDPWYFAGVEDTRTRLADTGFTDVAVSLEPAPTTLADAEAYREFISCVCVRHHVDRLPPQPREAFVRELASLAAHDDPPFTLDYWRLNISARRRSAS